MGDALRPLTPRRRVQIGVENASTPELKLQAGALAHLQRRSAEPLNQLACGQPEQIAAQLLLRRRGLLRWGRTLRSGGAARDEQSGDGHETTHCGMMDGGPEPRKLARLSPGG